MNDSRSYKSETFDKAVRLLNNPKKGIIIEQDKKERFEAMVEKIKSMKLEIDEEEVWLLFLQNFFRDFTKMHLKSS